MQDKSLLFTYQSLGVLSVDAAQRIVEIANQAIAERGVFRIALAGGSTPRGLYEVLGGEPYANKTDWSLWKVYFSDERMVPLTDERSNYAMAKSTLFNDSRFKEGNIYMPPVHLSSPAEVALAYETMIRRSFTVNTNATPSFDLVLLGLGSDGHTASLFPGKPAVEAVSRLVVESHSGILPPPVDRITFTVPFINAARHIIFLASGEDKQAAFKSAYTGVALKDVQPVPAYLIRPVSGTLEWFVTQDLIEEE
jgi:6-phosphogluconolactonase